MARPRKRSKIGTYREMKEAVSKGLSFEECFETLGLPEFQFVKAGGRVWRIPTRRDLKAYYEELQQTQRLRDG